MPWCFNLNCVVGGGVVGQAEGYDVTEDGNSAQQNWSCKTEF